MWKGGPDIVDFEFPDNFDSLSWGCGTGCKEKVRFQITILAVKIPSV